MSLRVHSTVPTQQYLCLVLPLYSHPPRLISSCLFAIAAGFVLVLLVYFIVSFSLNFFLSLLDFLFVCFFEGGFVLCCGFSFFFFFF